MSPGLYCITVKDALAKTQEAMRQVDQEAVVYAFIDDTYLIGSPAAVQRGCEIFAQELALLGLSLNESKTKYWGPNVTAEEMPEAMRPYRIATLKAVGAIVPYARAERSSQGAPPNRDGSGERSPQGVPPNRDGSGAQSSQGAPPNRDGSEAPPHRDGFDEDDWRDTIVDIDFECNNHEGFLDMQGQFLARLEALIKQKG
jgi:hypothetical protein